MIPGTALPELVLFKLRGRLRRWVDERGGWTAASGREDLWARTWLQHAPGAAEWLNRPGGGKFWMTPEVGRRWARRRCSDLDLEVSRRLLAGELGLLGVDSAEIGNPPKWRRDLYSGREWPAIPAGAALVRGDGSDIRTVWELSRGYHLVPLAKAYRRTGNPAFLDLFRSHIESWLTDNPPGLGPNWWSPMDVGIRSANWILALLLLADAPLPQAFWARLLANLRLSAWYIERYLEWHPVWRGNHYVANGVGLVYVGALFADEPQGRHWLTRGATILREEMTNQVHADGVSFEASLAYHRLVTEFFTYGGELVRLNLSEGLTKDYQVSLGRMHRFLADYLPESGEAPMLGDADDGRLHALCAESMRHPRRHRLGLPPTISSDRTPGSAAYQEGGFYILRGPDSHAVIRCGAVGLRGAGTHDHNDQLSFELVIGGVRLVADSGTFAYTRNLAERFAFRSTAAHNVPELGGEEQNPISVDRPWRILRDRTRSECIGWEAGRDAARFTGRHFGYRHRNSRAVCSRTVTASFVSGDWLIEDSFEGRGAESLVWRLHLVPGGVETRREGAEWIIVHSAAPHVTIRVVAPDPMVFSVGSSRMSDRYGEAVARPVLVLTGTIGLPQKVSCRMTLPAGSPSVPNARSSPPGR